MKCPYKVVASPDRSNISFVVQKIQNNYSIVDHFECIVSDICLKGKDTIRTIIYCQTIVQCSTVYNLLASKLGGTMYLPSDRKPQERQNEMMK